MARKKNFRSLRYEEMNDTTFTLIDYSTGFDPDSIFSRPLDERPQWLVNIVNIGIVGQYAIPCNTRDSTGFVLWFDVTPKANKLIEFHNFNSSVSGYTE